MKNKSKKPLPQKRKTSQKEEEVRKLVLARMMVVPRNIAISIGSNEYSPEELTEHIQKGDKVGKQLMKIQMEFLRDMASGAYETENE